MSKYCFLVASRSNRWSITLPEAEPRVFTTEQGAKDARSEWLLKAREEEQREHAEATEKADRERKQFEADTEIETVTVSNPNFLQTDFRKPMVRFPDGSESQFKEGTPETAIVAHIEQVALERNPKPDPEPITAPEIEQIPAWQAELLLDGERRGFEDILSWDYYFPMEPIAQILNTLADDGWAVTHVSEDRGLYASDLASNMSAPINVRYLLARE